MTFYFKTTDDQGREISVEACGQRGSRGERERGTGLQLCPDDRDELDISEARTVAGNQPVAISKELEARLLEEAEAFLRRGDDE